MDLRQQANNVANQGRYGDSMLLHVNPMEMKGLASAMPLTVNPQTGQPEAFLPFLAPLLGSVLGKALLGKTLGTVAASAIGSGLAQTAATGDVRKGLLAGLTGFGVGKFLDGISGAGAEIAGQEAAKTALQQSGVPLTGEVGKNIIAKAGAQNVADAATSAATTTTGNVLQNLSSQGTELANIFEPAISPNVKTDIFSSISQATGSPVQDIPNLLPSGLEVGAKSVMETLSDPMVYLPAGIGMGTTAQMISQEEFESYLAGAPEREKERIRKLMAMYPEAIPVQEGGFLNDPLIYEAGRALALDEINKRTRRQMSPERKAAYERAFALYGTNTLSGLESRPGGGNNNQGNGQFGGGEDDPLIRRANPIPQGFMGGFAPEFSYFNNVNPSATALQQGTSGQAGLGGQGRFMPQTGSGLQLANRDLFNQAEARTYADAFASSVPDLTDRQRQQARDYALQMRQGGDNQMPDFLADKDFLKGFEGGNRAASQFNPNQAGIATSGQFSPTQTAGYRQFYGSSAIGVPQVIDPNAATQGFSVSPFTPSALSPPMAPPPSTGTGSDQDTGQDGGQRGEEDTDTGQGDQTKEETRDAGTETRFLPDLTKDQFDLMLQGQEDYKGIRKTFEDILGIPETETPVEDSPVVDTPVVDTPDYAQQLADQAELIQQLQEQIASNQQAISGIPSVDTSGFLTQDDLSTAISGIPQFDPSTINFSDIQGVPDFATTDQLFDPSTLDLSGFATTDQLFDPSTLDLSGFATTDDLSTAIGNIPQFDPSTLDLSGFATQDDLSTAISGIPQFDPSTLGLPDFSDFATTEDLSTAISDVPQFDPTTIDFSNVDFSGVDFGFDPSQFATTEDLSTAISGVPQFDPSTLDFSDFATTDDLSTAISGIPQFDPSTLGLPDFSQFATTDQLFDPSTLDFSDFATTDDLSSAISGVPQFDPTTINFSDIQGIPDFSQFATTDQLFDPSTLDFSNFATTDQLFDPSQSSFLTSNDLSSLFTVGDPRSVSSDSPYAALEKSLMSRFNKARQFADTTPIGDQQNRLRDLYNTFTPSPTTINFSDIQGVPDLTPAIDFSDISGVPDFSQFATTDQLFDPSTLDFSGFATTDQLFDPSTLGLPDFSQFATTDQLFDPSTLQTQIDNLQSLLDQQGGTPQSESNPVSGPTVIGPLVGAKGTGDSIGRSDGGSLKTVPEDNKGLSKLPEDVRNKMGYMAPGGNTEFPDLTGDGKVTQADILKGRGVELKSNGGVTEAMLADPLTNQVAQFILGNETNDEVISAFIEKYGPTSFRELRRAVLKTLAPNAQTEGMIKGSLAGGMKDDIFGVIGDPEKNGQRVAVSQDEFIVPADVVSMLGDGSSDAGANKLYNMMKRIREEKTNTTKQARPINDNKVMPA